MRIAIFWNYLFDYRVPFYERLAQLPGVQLTVFHGGNDPNRHGTHQTQRATHAFRSITIRTHQQPLWGAVVYFQTGMWKYLLKEKFDVIVCEGNFGILSNLLLAVYSSLTRSGFFYWVAGWERHKTSGLAAILRRAYIGAFGRFATGYLCYGSGATRFLASYGIQGPMTVVQNTVDTESIAQEYAHKTSASTTLRRRLLVDNKLIILHVGALIPRKNTECLLDAYSILRQTRDDVALVIVGDGPQRQLLVDKVVCTGLPDVHFAGEVIDGVGDYFLLADVFVLPGLGGLAINQAMAYGLPVICASADGTERDLILPNETGLLFIRNDARDLARQISLLLSDADKRDAMGAAARRHVYEIASMSGMVSSFMLAVAPRRTTYI